MLLSEVISNIREKREIVSIFDNKKNKVKDKKEENFQVLFRKSSTSVVQLDNHLVEGVVVSIKENIYTVNLGLKMTFRFELNKLLENNTIKIGDRIQFMIEHLETHDGEMILNYEKAIKEIKLINIWSTIEKSKESINGIILNHVEGGFSIGLGGIVAFLPKDQVLPIKNRNEESNSLIGSLRTFQILKINDLGLKKNIVVSLIENTKNSMTVNKRR